MPKQPPLFDDVIFAWLIAAAFCAIAAIPLTIAGLTSLFNALRGSPSEFTLLQWALVTTTIFASYFVAATLAAPIYWMTRPFRPGLVGYLISGVLITPVIYGSVGLVAYLAWEPAGRIIFSNHGETREGFLADLPTMLKVFAGLGAPAGALFWWKTRSAAG